MVGNSRCWFVLNYISPSLKRRETVEYVIEKFNTSTGISLDVFAPTFVEVALDGDRVRTVEKPLLFHYVFVRGEKEEVKELCSMVEGFSFVLNHAGANRYLTIQPASLEAFRIIARLYGYKLPCFPVNETLLETGDEVEVMVGPFAGLQGTYISRKGSSQGNILISVTQNLAAVAYDIKAEYVRIIRFARDSKRAYDQIEAFVPRLFTALRLFESDEKMSPSDIAPLIVFCRRMDHVFLNNPKLDAKLQLLLMTAYEILGNHEECRLARERYSRLEGQMTNVWTIGLSKLLTGVTDGNIRELEQGFKIIGGDTDRKMSKSQAALVAEYEHYLSKHHSCVADLEI
ncbi:MAG: hypothetical protein HDR85_01515 [Bacteroides sp.]|nr:hypothetical protein [Bacteroides sp.]